MYCKHCGTDLEENVKFCPNCGAEQTVEPTDEAPAAEPVVDNAFEEKKETLAGSVLVWGILGLVFAASSWLAILGIIFSNIAKKKAAEYEAFAGELEGRAKAGSILAKIGMIVGIVTVIILAISFVVGFIAGLAGAV